MATISFKLGNMIYLLDYRDKYKQYEFPEAFFSPHNLSELFLFRTWIAQFGFRRLTSVSMYTEEEFLYQIVNELSTLGVGSFEFTHKFKIEDVLKDNFDNLMEARWYEYDQVVIDYQNDPNVTDKNLSKLVCGDRNLMVSVAECLNDHLVGVEHELIFPALCLEAIVQMNDINLVVNPLLLQK